MIKKSVFLAVLAVVIGAVPAMAWNDTYFKPGTLTAQAGAGLYWGGFVEVEGGVDYAFEQADLSPEFPLDFGLAGRAAFSNYGFGVGVFATAHYSWKSLRTKLDWLNHMETYLGLGIDLLPGVSLDAFGGVSYHLNEKWAIYVEGGFHDSVLGAQYRF